MEKLKMHSPDFTDENVARIAELFPNCLTEARDEESGAVKRAIDFDLLRQELSDHIIVDGPRERYHLDWPGKREALLAANAPIAKTLRPCREESVDFDTTKNLFIEGDNLDALKLLQETYLGKVKMIYIDPPYNTGNDFVYNDRFASTTKEYLSSSTQVSDDGERMVANYDSNGRFHSAWLSMILPRIKIARNLLRSDGVIFISINDIEVPNLRKICDEVFGAENFLGQLIWHSKKGGGGGVKTVVSEHEYIVAYAKTDPESAVGRERVDAVKLNDKDEFGPYLKGRELNKWGANSARADRPTMFFAIPGPNGEDVYPIRNDGSEGRWRMGKATLLNIINQNNASFEQREDGSFIVYEKIRSSQERFKSYRTLIGDVGSSADGTARLKKLFNEKSPFDFPKPPSLMIKLLGISAVDNGDVVLDFFAGSGTTADAVMEFQAEREITVQALSIQLPEKTEIEDYSTIAEITKERIRRAGKKIKEENPEIAADVDIGFRVLKIDTSNLQDVYYQPDGVAQEDLLAQTDNIKPDRTDEDLLFQVLLDWGVDLTLPIVREELAGGSTVFFVDDNALAACFEKNIDDALITAIAERKPLRAVFRDAGFADDSAKINAEQIFKMKSPETEVRAI